MGEWKEGRVRKSKVTGRQANPHQGIHSLSLVTVNTETAGVAEIAQLVKCMLHSHEDLSLILKTHMKSQVQ